MIPANAPRRPRAFDADDPKLTAAVEAPENQSSAEKTPPPLDPSIEANETMSSRLTKNGSWGTVLLSAIAGLFCLSTSLWFTNVIWSAFQRNDWLGWTATALLVIAGFATLIILLGELRGLFQLRSIRKIRELAEQARQNRDLASERKATRRLAYMLSARRDLAWPLARFREHARDIHDPGELLHLAERELLSPLDRQAQRCVLASARRVSIVTAVSPTGILSVGYVLFENLRMLRTLATLYGGRPGFTGSLRLARMVFLHILATGGIALTDDLLGQFIGQDILRRLSRRLGEGVFNGALTARIGTAAMTVVRPLPFIANEPPRIRAVLAELFRKQPSPADAAPQR